MVLLVFAEVLPLMKESIFTGGRVSTGLSFREPPKTGETWLFSCAAAWIIYIFSYFKILWG